MTLRQRALLAAIVTALTCLMLGVVVTIQYSATASTAIGIRERLAPASDAAGALLLAVSDAGGSLSDYVLLEREASRSEVERSLDRAGVLIDQIEQVVGEDPAVAPLVQAVRNALQDWVDADVDKTITAMDAGLSRRAKQLTNSERAWSTYDTMTKAAMDLRQAIDGRAEAATQEQANFTRTLGILLGVTGSMIVLAFIGFFFAVRRWVLKPLDEIRADLLRAAQQPDHEHPINAVGPIELQELADDAEYLRRELVHEIDLARAAQEGLRQGAPLVEAVSSAMARPSTVDLPGLRVFGSVQAAEGVLAGDWWDAFARPDGSLALVVADVSGHGSKASVVALQVRTVLDSMLRTEAGPDTALEQAAAVLADQEDFVTAIAMVIDPFAGTLTWANAGHHPALIIDRDKQLADCPPTGPLLSSLGGSWTTRQLPFQQGDLVLAFTDGVLESRDSQGEEFGLIGVRQFLRGCDQTIRENPAEVVARLTARLRDRAAAWRQDDVTIAAVARLR